MIDVLSLIYLLGFAASLRLVASVALEDDLLPADETSLLAFVALAGIVSAMWPVYAVSIVLAEAIGAVVGA